MGPWIRGNLPSGRLKDNEVILGSNAHIFFGKSESHVGDKEVFYGKEFTVVGILEPTGIGIDDGGFVTLESVYVMTRTSESSEVIKLQNIKSGDISALMVNTKPNYSRGEVATAIESQVPGVAVVTSKELMSSSVARQLESLTPYLLVIGAGFWIISVLMIGALFSMIVNERRRELGLLQAIGATRSYLFRLVMLEAVELTTIGGLCGIAVGAVSIFVFKGTIENSLGIAYLMPGTQFIAVFSTGLMLMAIGTGILAALYPAIMASRLEPYQAIRTGE